jgi:hypothetical protein
MPIYLGHVFRTVTSPKARALAKRDIRVIECINCEKVVRLPLRSKESVLSLLEHIPLDRCPTIARQAESKVPPKPVAKRASELTFVDGLQWAVSHLKACLHMNHKDIPAIIKRLESLIEAETKGVRRRVHISVPHLSSHLSKRRSQPGLPEAITVIQKLLKSARPNQANHPTMTAAWKEAEEFLTHVPIKS